jgi:hypothetical protein
MRTGVAWLLAVATFVVFELIASFVGGRIGVPISLDVDPYTVHYGRGAEDELDSITTAYGWGIHVLGILAAVAVWNLVQGKQPAPTARAQFKGFVLGAAIMVVGGIPLWLIFNQTNGFITVVGNLLELGLAAGSIFAGIQLTKRIESKSS